MSDIHITLELLQAVDRGELPARVLVEIGWKHLLALCPTCRDEYLAWRKDKASSSRYGPPVDVLPAVLERHGLEESERDAAAEQDFKDLLRIPREVRRSKIRRAHRRFRGTLLARRLLDESKRRMTTDPDGADDLAETAEAVLLHTPESPGLADLRALVAVYRGNVSRLQGRPDEARTRFGQARSIIRNAGVTDPLLFAETDSCEAVLALEQRRFSEAEELLNRSVALYILGNARDKAAQPLITLSNLYADQGDPMRAIEVTQAALALIDLRKDLRLFVFALLNNGFSFTDAGLHREAAKVLRENRELFDQFPDPYVQLRITWLESRIAAASGDLKRAEDGFLSLREELVLRQEGYDAAMVSLDLALIYQQQDRTGELMRLAEEMHALFSAEEVHREALAALLMFEEAARKEQVTAETIRRVAGSLRRWRR